jgi:hypothetical protein
MPQKITAILVFVLSPLLVLTFFSRWRPHFPRWRGPPCVCFIRVADFRLYFKMALPCTFHFAQDGGPPRVCCVRTTDFHFGQDGDAVLVFV